MHPFAAITIKGLYEDAACIIPGNNEQYCPRGPHNEDSPVQHCWGGHCASHTSFCSSMRVAHFNRETHRDPINNKLQVKMTPVWETKRAQHTCCHYPETEGVWDSRWARVDLYDEDTLNANDYLAGFDLDLQNKTGGEFEFVVPEHKEDMSIAGNNITMKVATFWHRPMEYQISHEFDRDPRRWSSAGLSVTSSDPPWEVHREFDGRFGNLHAEQITEEDEEVLDKEAHLRMEQDPDLANKVKAVQEAQEERDRIEAQWEESLVDAYELKSQPAAGASSGASVFSGITGFLGIAAAVFALIAYRRRSTGDGSSGRSLLGDGAVSSSNDPVGTAL
uniref:Uncharacterized protein n=2 Tax=Eukaryota TaxID=2759 RepID=X5DAH7_9EUKA